MALDRINATALLDGGVTTADIADDAVTTAKLATQTGNVDFADGGRIRLGDSQDLQIYHDGSDSYVRDNGTGDLYIEGSDDIRFRTTSGQTYAVFNENASVNLYHNDTLKFETTATGVDVTGALTTTSGATIAGGDLLLDGGSPEIIFQTAASHYNWMVAAQENVSNALEISSGSQDGDYSNDTWTPRLVVTSDGNVGIGTSSPAATSSTYKNLQVALAATVSGRTDDSPLYLSSNLSYNNGWKYIANTTATQIGLGTNIQFFTAPAGTSGAGATLTERMRIKDNGNLLLNRTTDLDTSMIAISQQDSKNAISIQAPNTNAFMAMQFYNSSGSRVGYIQYSNTNTVYSTSSDYRLKENVTADWDATTRLKQLNPVRFNFIADTDTTVDGFLAHEVQSVVPEAITGEKDAMRDEEYEVTPAVLDEDGNEVTPAVMGTRSVPDYQGIDQGKLVPLLVKSLQEALDKIDTLETRLEALENA